MRDEDWRMLLDVVLVQRKLILIHFDAVDVKSLVKQWRMCRAKAVPNPYLELCDCHISSNIHPHRASIFPYQLDGEWWPDMIIQWLVILNKFGSRARSPVFMLFLVI